MAKPVKSVELRYQMIQFLIKKKTIFRYTASTVKFSDSGLNLDCHFCCKTGIFQLHVTVVELSS